MNQIKKNKVKSTSAKKELEKLKKGGVKDNIPEGYSLHVPGKLILQYFKKELMEKFCVNPDGTPFKYLHGKPRYNDESLNKDDSDSIKEK